MNRRGLTAGDLHGYIMFRLETAKPAIGKRVSSGR